MYLTLLFLVNVISNVCSEIGMLHFALPLLPLNCMEVEAQCLQDLASHVIHHPDRGRHCCRRCSEHQYCSTRGAEDHPHHDA